MSGTDFVFETEVLFESGRLEQIWINVRRSTEGAECTGYSVGGNRYGLAITRVDPIAACQVVTLSDASDYPLISGGRYQIRIEVQGPEIRLFVNNKLVLTANDDTFPKGDIAISVYEVKWAYFDNIRVYKINEDVSTSETVDAQTTTSQSQTTTMSPTEFQAVLDSAEVTYEDNFDNTLFPGWQRTGGNFSTLYAQDNIAFFVGDAQLHRNYGLQENEAILVLQRKVRRESC